MEHFYTVIEKQISSGAPGTLTSHYTSESQALAKYYTILAAAAASSIEYHAAFVVRDDGVMTEGRVFDRREAAEEGK